MAPIDSKTILIFGGGQGLKEESHTQDAAAILFDTETNNFERVLDCPDALLQVSSTSNSCERILDNYTCAIVRDSEPQEQSALW